MFNFRKVIGAIAAVMSATGPDPLPKPTATTQWVGLMRRDPNKLPGNWGNNAGRHKPHQGAKECARRVRQAHPARYAVAA